jgi:hypothetical protein
MSDLGLTRSALANLPAAAGLTHVGVLRTSDTTRYRSAALDPGAATTLALGRHDFSFSLSTDAASAQPTTYLSTTFDPDAAPTMAPGPYTFGMEYDGRSRELSVTVRADWTWGDVMRGVAAAVRARRPWPRTGA